MGITKMLVWSLWGFPIEKWYECCGDFPIDSDMMVVGNSQVTKWKQMMGIYLQIFDFLHKEIFKSVSKRNILLYKVSEIKQWAQP